MSLTAGSCHESRLPPGILPAELVRFISMHIRSAMMDAARALTDATEFQTRLRRAITSHEACGQRTGQPYISPPSRHWAFNPRSSFIGVSIPILRSKLSP